MLAPLEDRSVLADISAADREISDLRRALRESRLRLRRSAWQSTRQISLLNAEVSRLQTLCDSLREQLAGFSSGTAIVDIGRKLMEMTEANTHLREVARRSLMLEQILNTVRADLERLSSERDALARELGFSSLGSRVGA